MTAQAVEIDGRTIKVTNLDRVMYPADGFTKAEVLQYYLTVSEPLGRQLRDRLLTRKRWPHGVGTESFFEKNQPASGPDWIDTVTAGSEPVRYPVLREDRPNAALAWFAQIGVLELHVPQWRVLPGPEFQPPDRIVFDLDPGPPAGLPECQEVALAIRAMLADLDLTCQPVLSGNKGMQLYLPLPEAAGSRRSGGSSPQRSDSRSSSGRSSSAATGSPGSKVPVHRGMDAEATSEFARTVALALEEAMPKLVVSRMVKSIRGGKVLMDWSQNNASKTTISPYSLRGTEYARVAAPLTWDEVEAGDLRQLGPKDVVERLNRLGDPFAADA